MKRIAIIFLLFMMLLPSFVYANSNSVNKTVNPYTGYSMSVLDLADIFDSLDVLTITSEMEPVLNYGNAMCVTYGRNSASWKKLQGKTTSEKAGILANYYLDGNGVLFLIDMEGREIYIYAVGPVYDVITKSYANIIADNTYKYASNRRYGKCASATFEQIAARLQGYRIAEPLRYITSVLMALICGVFVNFLIVYGSRKKRSRKKLKNMKIDMKILNLKTRVTSKTKIQSSSGGGSGGSRGGGGFSGGGFSGGGGGHRF